MCVRLDTVAETSRNRRVLGMVVSGRGIMTMMMEQIKWTATRHYIVTVYVMQNIRSSNTTSCQGAKERIEFT